MDVVPWTKLKPFRSLEGSYGNLGAKNPQLALSDFATDELCKGLESVYLLRFRCGKFPAKMISGLGASRFPMPNNISQGYAPVRSLAFMRRHAMSCF